MKVAEFDIGDRVLSANELATYWKHLDQVPSFTVRGLLRAHLLLGGQRIAQLARLKHTNVNLESSFIRLRDSKGRDGVPRDHLLPLTDRVQRILEETPHVESTEGWIFRSDGRASVRAETVSKAVSEFAEWRRTRG